MVSHVPPYHISRITESSILGFVLKDVCVASSLGRQKQHLLREQRVSLLAALEDKDSVCLQSNVKPGLLSSVMIWVPLF